MSTVWVVAYCVLAAAVLTLAVIVLGFLRRATAVLEEAESRLGADAGHPSDMPKAGTSIAPFVAGNVGGDVLSSSTLLAEAAIYLFLGRECLPCRDLAAELGRLGSSPVSAPLRVVVEDASAFQLPTWVEVLVQREREVARAFGTSVTPHAIAVSTGQVVKTVVPQSPRDLKSLDRALARGGDTARRQQVAVTS